MPVKSQVSSYSYPIHHYKIPSISYSCPFDIPIFFKGDSLLGIILLEKYI